MKQNLVNDVMQAMLPYLNNDQLEKLQKVMQYVLFQYEINIPRRKRRGMLFS